MPKSNVPKSDATTPPALKNGRSKAITATAVKPTAKPTAKPAPKKTVKPSMPANARATATTRVAKPAKSAKPVVAAKPAKPGKLRQKPVRDSFTMPEADFALIATLKARALAARRETKKSELLRAGLHVLAALDAPALLAALGQLDPVKVGRPKKDH